MAGSSAAGRLPDPAGLLALLLLVALLLLLTTEPLLPPLVGVLGVPGVAPMFRPSCEATDLLSNPVALPLRSPYWILRWMLPDTGSCALRAASGNQWSMASVLDTSALLNVTVHWPINCSVRALSVFCLTWATDGAGYPEREQAGV